MAVSYLIENFHFFQVEQRALEVSMALSLLEMLNNEDYDTESNVRNVIESGFDFSTLKVSSLIIY